MSTTKTTSTENNNNNKHLPMERMFDFSRFELTTSNLFSILLYGPLGLCLFIIRLFIFLYVLLISQILPHNSSFRRSMFFVLGLSVDVDEEYFKQLKTKFIISNHISDMDPIVLSLIMPCACVNANQSGFPGYVNWLCRMLKIDGGDDQDNSMEVTMKNIPIVCFPEQSKSNGRAGLFKFSTSLFNHHVPLVHLVFLKIRRPVFDFINVSPVNSHWLADLFWILFLPITIFEVKHLGTVTKEENETTEDFVKRSQTEMANKMQIQATNYDLYDKCEFIKRRETELKQQQQQQMKKRLSSRASSKKGDSKIDEYSRKVKEILPQVPLNVIREDIKVTNNIDNTIERILSGVIKYEPEELPTGSLESLSGDCDSGNKLLLSTIVNNDDPTSKTVFVDQKNFGAKSFGKTPAERFASFEERKELMYRVARIRYMQKHGRNLDKKETN